MSLFQCENCGCRENTALSFQGDSGMRHMYDGFLWDNNQDRIGKKLCSACSPEYFIDGVNDYQPDTNEYHDHWGFEVSSVDKTGIVPIGLNNDNATLWFELPDIVF